MKGIKECKLTLSAMGVRVRDGHVTTVQGQIYPGPGLIGLSSFFCNTKSFSCRSTGNTGYLVLLHNSNNKLIIELNF